MSGVALVLEPSTIAAVAFAHSRPYFRGEHRVGCPLSHHPLRVVVTFAQSLGVVWAFTVAPLAGPA